MSQSTPIINILTSGLSGEVTHPIYIEYNSRRRELDRIWAKEDNNYRELMAYVPTVEALLAIAIFYRQVLGLLQGATSFYKSVNEKSGRTRECAISIGKSILDKKQQGYLLSAVISFNKIREKYQLPPVFFEYSETIQFLRNCKDLFYKKDDEEDKSI